MFLLELHPKLEFQAQVALKSQKQLILIRQDWHKSGAQVFHTGYNSCFQKEKQAVCKIQIKALTLNGLQSHILLQKHALGLVCIIFWSLGLQQCVHLVRRHIIDHTIISTE